MAVDLRKRLGDWFGVEKLVASVPNAGDDDTLHAAWRHIGDYFADRRKWAKAVGYYRKTRDRSVAVPRLAECYYALEDFESLEALIEEAGTPEGRTTPEVARCCWIWHKSSWASACARPRCARTRARATSKPPWTRAWR